MLCSVVCAVFCTGEFEVRLTVTGRQGKGTRSDQYILVKTIVVAQRRERKGECGKETIYSRGRLAGGMVGQATGDVPKA